MADQKTLTVREALLLVLDQVDYTNGACSFTEVVGACLPAEVIDRARQALAADGVAVLNTLHGFSRDDLECIAEGLEKGYEPTVNVGNTTGEGDELLESTTAAAARFIRSALGVKEYDAGPFFGPDEVCAPHGNKLPCEACFADGVMGPREGQTP